MNRIEIAGDNHLETLRRCGGYYACPTSPGTGERMGPLVGYAGKYVSPDAKKLQFVGDVYANFAKAEVHPLVLQFFADNLFNRLSETVGIENIDAVCGAPIGGYSLADALGFALQDVRVIKAEKKVTALVTADSREQSELVFARHSVEPGERVVIVEDVCNNFSTTDKLVKLIWEGGGKVITIACFLNRSLTVDSSYPWDFTDIPVVSLVRMPINEWKQDDPAVVDDIAKGNVVWKPKNEWDRLMQAMG